MMTKTLYLLIAIASLCLSACSTSPIAQYDPSLDIDQDHATVYLYRGETKTKNSVNLRVNGKNAGKLKNGTYLTVKLPIGSHTLSTRSRSFGYDSNAVITTMQVDVKAGDTLLMTYSEDTRDIQVSENYAFVKMNATLSVVDKSTAEYDSLKTRISSL